jgi:hypothetical protein
LACFRVFFFFFVFLSTTGEPKKKGDSLGTAVFVRTRKSFHSTFTRKKKKKTNLAEWPFFFHLLPVFFGPLKLNMIMIPTKAPSGSKGIK